MTLYTSAELDQVKARADVLDIAERHVKLRKIAADEWAGPCPQCGGRDRFHVNKRSQSWMCSNCTGRETWGDVIGLVQHIDGCDFPTAVETLGGRRNMPAAPVTPRQPEPPKLQQDWKDPEWQARIHQLVDTSAKRLDDDAGAPGRDYLAQRGIELRTAYAWVLGYAPISPPRDKEQRKRVGGPSITMPYLRHVDERIMAVRYRRINPHEDRYINEWGSVTRLFGLHLLNMNAATLVVVEGELNAISIWQAGREIDLTVVSIGGRSLGEQTLSDVGRLSERFERCIVWCDEPEKAQRLRAAATSPMVRMRQSPKVAGGKVDANDMLQRGVLAPFLSRVLANATDRQPAEVPA